MYAGHYPLLANYQYFTASNPLNRSIAVSEKISFKGRQKRRDKQISSIAIFEYVLACVNCNCACLYGLVFRMF